MKNVLFIVLMVIAVMVSGCTESERPVYGKGDPPAEYQKYFGNDNGARLDFMQNKAINKLSNRIAVLEKANDPNEVE